MSTYKDKYIKYKKKYFSLKYGGSSSNDAYSAISAIGEECDITCEKGDTLVRTSIRSLSEMKSDFRKKLKEQYSYLEGEDEKEIKIIYYKNIKITRETSILEECPFTRRMYTEEEKQRLKFKYNTKDLKKTDYERLKNDEKIVRNFKINGKFKIETVINEQLLDKFLIVEDLRHFYDPTQILELNSGFKAQVRKLDAIICANRQLKWVIRQSNTYKPIEFTYDEDNEKFAIAQKKYTIYLQKFKGHIFIIHNIGIGYTVRFIFRDTGIEDRFKGPSLNHCFRFLVRQNYI